MTNNDSVHNPSHYAKNGIFPGECIDYARQLNGVDFNAFKYIWRHLDKDNPIQDLDKANWYLDYAIHHSGEFNESIPSQDTIDFLAQETYSSKSETDKDKYFMCMKLALSHIFKGRHRDAQENISVLKKFLQEGII